MVASTIKIYNFKTHELFKEKALIIINKENAKVISVGNECEEIMGNNTNPNYIMVTPFKEGKLDDFTVAEKLLKPILLKYVGKPGFMAKNRKALVMVHADCNDVEKKAFQDLAFVSGYVDITYMDENVQGIKPGSKWEDVIWALGNEYKLRVAIEFDK